MANDRTRLPATVTMAIGIGIGIIWVGLATVALLSAAEGLANGRTDWALGWGLVGVLLLAAGLAAAIGAWWHEKKVAPPRH